MKKNQAKQESTPGSEKIYSYRYYAKCASLGQVITCQGIMGDEEL